MGRALRPPHDRTPGPGARRWLKAAVVSGHPAMTQQRQRRHLVRWCLLTFVAALFAAVATNDVGVWLRPKGPLPTSVPAGANRYQRGGVEWNWTADTHTFFTTIDALAVYATPSMPNGAGLAPPRWALANDGLWSPDRAGGVQVSPFRLTAVGWPFRCYVHDGDQWSLYAPGVLRNLAVVIGVSMIPPFWLFTIAALRRWRIYRLGPGHCRNCGYPLLSLPAGSECPECGH